MKGPPFGGNRNHHSYSPTIQQQLLRVLKSLPPHWLPIMPLTLGDEDRAGSIDNLSQAHCDRTILPDVTAAGDGAPMDAFR